MLDMFIMVTASIRSILSWPVRLLLLTLGVANFKIIYKSGHVEYLFLNNFEGTTSGGGLASIQWHSLGGKAPVHIGVNKISAVYKLY